MNFKDFLSGWMPLGPVGVLLAGAVLSACLRPTPMPVLSGAVIEVRRSDVSIPRGSPGWRDTLQLSWFGSGCHVIQLGDLVVLTDPFVTNGFKLANLRSDPVRVAATLEKIDPPAAVLINHTHFDHFLDAHAALSIPSWKRNAVPLFGGQSAQNLIAGWQDDEVTARCKVIRAPGIVIDRKSPDGGHLRVTAFASRHSPHFKCGLTLADGKVTKPFDRIPSAMTDYQSGEVFNYLIELRNSKVSYHIFYLGAFRDLKQMPDSLPPAGTRIDVAILTAPGAGNVDGYPKDHLAHLRPRHILLSHFNTFMRERPDEQLSILGKDFVELSAVSRDIQSTFAGTACGYPEFEKLHIPAITVMESHGRGRNVIHIR